jgi:dihydropteroate synthase
LRLKAALRLRNGRELPLDRRVLVMGVVNRTPDSFYSPSRPAAAEAALAQALRLVEEGADILDLGGESTRPGAAAVAPAEEMERVLPLLEQLRRASPVAISIDTRSAAVARRALELGADIVNDVSGLEHDPEMPAVVREHGAVAVVMHMRGDPRTMTALARYQDVVAEVKAELERRLRDLERQGLDRGRLLVDPGIGFAKDAAQSYELIARLDELQDLGCPILVGASRKSFLARADGGVALAPGERLEGSLAAATASVLRGARVLRVHDVAATRRAVAVAEAIRERSRARGLARA